MRKIFQLIILLVGVFPLTLFAGVNLKNGNFYTAYTDIVVPGGSIDMEITRTYNSKASVSGWFGFGWGSDFETNLKVSADGSITIYEHGAGSTTRFTTEQDVHAEEAAKKIVDAMRKRTTLSDMVAADLIKKLKSDAELRGAYSVKFDVKAQIAVGTVLGNKSRGIQQLVRTKTGYERSSSEGKIEVFDDEGRMVKIKDKSGYVLDLNYKNGRLESIKDTIGRQLFFAWYPDGRVKNIWSAGDKKAEYKYNGKNLIESKDVENNVYKYAYDGMHNMTEIAYSDGSKMKISYAPKTQFVSEIVARDGEVTKYKYDSNPKNPDYHYWTTVTKKSLNGKDVSNRYEYEIKVKPDGEYYTYRIKTDIDGISTETIYNECCSLPTKITRGKQVTNFEYNPKGLLVKKTSSSGEFVQLEYNDKINKISRVVNNEGWTNFVYDEKGNLYKATNSQNKAVLLIYDRMGRIVKMIDQEGKSNEKKTLSFKYNALGKPVEIAMDDVGKINVAYDNYGEIKKVESASGQKMALQVTQVFQSLLSIVKPAGVNLSL